MTQRLQNTSHCLMHFGPDFGDRMDKTAASIRMALPARFEHMAQQEQAGELKTVEQVLI